MLDNVRLPCRFSKARAARARTGEAEALLERVVLPKAAWDRPASALSVGQQQRVAAARALIGAPELVIADEPTSALDADLRDGFMDLLLGAVRASGATLPGPRLEAQASKASPYKSISWDELVPKGWDPMKDFKGMDLAALKDNDPRAVKLLNKMREAWDNAPTNPAMVGQALRIAGFVVPLEETKDGLKEFLLVPYFGACIHTPPPAANQIIHVLLKTADKSLRSMDPVWVSGTLAELKTFSSMGAAGYRLDAQVVEPYKQQPAR